MQFIWDAQNIAHLATHRVTPTLAERIFSATDRVIFAAANDSTRFIIEGTVEANCYRLVFALVAPDSIYPITAFRIAPSRRRTP